MIEGKNPISYGIIVGLYQVLVHVLFPRADRSGGNGKRIKRGPLMRIAVLFALILLVGGCGSKKSGDTSSASAPAASTPFSGTFVGDQTGTQDGVNFSQGIKFVLSQAGNAVTGTWISGTGGSGTLQGTAVEATVSDLKIVEVDTLCPGTMTGTMTIVGKDIAARFTGTLPKCGLVVAAVVASKS